MREIQSENFGKDADVSMEIRIVSFQDTDMSWRVVSYSHLSDKKPQIAATTFQNTIDMLNDLKEKGDVSNNNFSLSYSLLIDAPVNTNVGQCCTY